MISSTLFHTDGSTGLLIGLTETDIQQITSGLPKVIDLDYVNLAERGALVISYLQSDDIVMVPLYADREHDIMIMLDGTQMRNLVNLKGTWSCEEPEAPFKIVLFYAASDTDCLLMMDQIFNAAGLLRPPGETPTEHIRPSMN